MILWFYLLGLTFTTAVAFKMFVKYEISDGWEVDAESIISIGMLSLIAGVLWPFAIVGFTVYTISDNYAKSLNANKK